MASAGSSQAPAPVSPSRLIWFTVALFVFAAGCIATGLRAELSAVPPVHFAEASDV